MVVVQAEAVSRLESDLSKREEKIFKDFSRRVGVANIREFESERLKLAEQYDAEKVALVNEQNNLQDQLDYERNRDLTAPINAAKAKIAEIEAQEKAKKKEMEAAEAESEKEQAKTADLLKDSVRLGKEMEAKQAQLKQTKKQSQTNTRQTPDKGSGCAWNTFAVCAVSHRVVRCACVVFVQLPISRPPCWRWTRACRCFALK